MSAYYRTRLAELNQEIDRYINDYEAYDSDDEVRRQTRGKEEEDDGMDYDEEEEQEEEGGGGEGGEKEGDLKAKPRYSGHGDIQVDAEDEGEDAGEDIEEDEDKYDDDDDGYSDSNSGRPKKSQPKPSTLVALLSQVTSLLREATAELSPSLNDDFSTIAHSADHSVQETANLIAEVDATFSRAMVFAYASEPHYGPYCESHAPSFAHDDTVVVVVEGDGDREDGGSKKRAPLLKDASAVNGRVFLDLDILKRLFGNLVDSSKLPKPAPGWKISYRPHPLSSPCARFREEAAEIDPLTSWSLPDPSSSSSSSSGDLETDLPLALSVFQARVEISSTDTPAPIDMQLSRPSGDTIVLTSSGGYKNRVPYASFYHPNDATTNVNNVAGGGGMRGRRIRLDLTSQAREMALYEGANGPQDTLVFVGDWERIKSYRCLPANAGGDGMNRRVHTLASEGFAGPIAILPGSDVSGQGERVIRCGKDGKIAVWDLSTLPVHTIDAASGRHSVIGDRINDDDLNTWRDDPELIERSSGSLPTSFIQLPLGDDYAHIKDIGSGEIGVWHAHPSKVGTMITGGGRHSQNESYFCHAFDLERAGGGGGPVMRYLGHGGIVEGFSTSLGYNDNDGVMRDGDPNVFLTWASDGHVRLYDTRLVLPVLTIAAAPGSSLSPVTAAALAHPSGIPFIFTSAHESECIKVWDVRAQRSVYELATGNNSVEDLAWDARTGTLFASTECQHLDLYTPGGGYRVAKIPKLDVYPADAAHDDYDEEEEEEEEEEEAAPAPAYDDDDDDNDKEGNKEPEEEDSEEYDPPDNYKCWPRRGIHQENYFGHVFDSGRHRIFQYKFKLDPDVSVLPPYGDAVATRRNDGPSMFGF